jgi:hypothetical protein
VHRFVHESRELISARSSCRLSPSEFFDSQLRNLRGIANAGLPDIYDRLGDTPQESSSREDNVAKPGKAALADLIGTINSSLRNHDGKGVQRTNEGGPARWKLKEAAN